MKHEGKTRMPAQGRRMNGKHRNADASENTSKPNQTKPNRSRNKPPHRECQKTLQNRTHVPLSNDIR
ncbi:MULTISPECIES: hypothetical protein [Paraburkholderia]|jgi:hypothetical protein|uniref:hypothetical protein n=1 Tax=Paraburkholderia TaxID=1822464 RepID=UPI00115FA84C|nr:hypothetical protein [Paraburkholderia hospita]